MSSLVRVCPKCNAICMALNARCNGCGADLSGTDLIRLQDIVDPTSDRTPRTDPGDSRK